MFNKFIQLIQEWEESLRDDDKVFVITDDGVIQVSDFETSAIPDRPKPSKTKLTNAQFKRFNTR